jgi:L-gulonate 5-dehydrogenase
MKEVVIVEPHSYVINEVNIPELKNEDDVLIKMKAAGVCGSDHHIYHGLNPCTSYPRIPGHENAGIIVQVGKNVTTIKVGDHVVVDLIHSCNQCYQCRIGRNNVCEKVQVRGSSVDGGWRQYITAPSAEVYKISDSVKWEDAALIEPYAIGAHCTQRGRVVPEDVVLILGVGTIGTIILQTCKLIGCKTVICCDIDEHSLLKAKEYGADFTINTQTEDLLEKVQQITKRKGVTIAFDSACFPGSLTQCLKPGIIRNAGRMVPLGFSTEKEGITQAMINQRELDIIGSRMSRCQFEPTIKHMENGELNTVGIATKFINFNEIERVFENMDNPSQESKKMVILFD